ncbi:DUF927 domain-containing protein [Shewanella canadensis]|uniref:DUF927 domain-containing protein n=1 Tax=Shewanella canadensis TaxID=271096 RepID=A0A431WSJ2_9GAMM|nr:DUF927 domain-containing protein [Shewanella canadensis]RTR38602.1 DUF927 domain-containing protein [Shewanella canadensis]
MNTETTVTEAETAMVTSSVDSNPCPLRLVEDVTNVTDVTISNTNHEEELYSYMVSKGSMAEGAEATVNSSGFWRFDDPEDAQGKNTGWCMPFYSEDGELTKAMFGTHRAEDEHQFWESTGYDALTDDEKSKFNTQMDERRAMLAEERESAMSEAREKLQSILVNCSKATCHPYLSDKGVASYDLYQGANDELYVPFHDIDDNFVTVQRIKPDGTKRIWAGCGKTGGFLKIAGDSRVILIAEGYATAASLFEATGYTCIMGIDAGNLVPVAKAIKERYSNSAIVVCCDNDQFKSQNKGAKTGKLISDTLGIPFILPQFEDLSSEPTDFNDLAQLEGDGVVVQQLDDIIEQARLRIPPGFSLNPTGIYHEVTTKDGSTFDNWVCSPLKITALTRDINGESWGRLIELIDKDATTHRFALPMTMLTGQPTDYLKPLVDRGLTYSHEQRNDLHYYLSQANPINRARCVDKTGWFDNIFVLPNDVIGEAEETIIYQSPSSLPKGFEVSGTIEQWQEHVASLCVGNSRLTFGVCVAFATALLPMLDGESGGFHFRCGSSRGKTTILMIAKSVWGSPDGLPRWRATANGLEGLASTHNHSLLCLDEFSQLAEVSPKVAGEAIYMLGNGEGKQRSRRDGSIGNRQTWQLLYLSAGEVSLKATLEQAGLTVRAGQEVRFIDLPADAGNNLGVFDTVHNFADGNRFAMAVKEHSLSFYGVAARHFIQKIAANYERYKEWLVSNVEAFTTSLDLANADPQVQRVAQRFAIIAAAGELASLLGTTGWDEGMANWSSTVCFSAWLEERGGSESHEETQALDTVKGRLLEHGTSRFINDDGRPQNGAVWGNQMTDGYYVFTKAFSEHICAGLDPKYVAKLLNDRGHLGTSGGRLTKSKRIDGRPVRCYHILPSLFADDEAVQDEPEQPEPSSDNQFDEYTV